MTDAVGAAQQPCESPKPCRYCGAAVRWLPMLSAAMWPFEAPCPQSWSQLATRTASSGSVVF